MNPTMPLVSVIIPCFNTAAFLSKAVQSVLAQTMPDMELIVVDDGSTDSTAAVVHSFSDQRITYIYQENQGLASARNTGLRAARGEYIAFLDADDWFLPPKLERQSAYLAQAPEIGLVASGYFFANEAGDRLYQVEPWLARPTLELSTWLMGCPVTVHSVLVRRAWLARVDGFDAALHRLEDWDLWLRLAYANCRMAWLPEIVCAYRMHTGQMVRNVSQQRDVAQIVLDKFFGQPGLPPEIQIQRSAAYAQLYLRAACREYGAGAVESACGDLAQALAIEPALLGKDGEPLLSLILGWVGNPVVGEAHSYLKSFFAHLPPAAASLHHFRRQTLARAAMLQFFNAHTRQDWQAVRRYGLQGVFYDPHWLTNRGVLAISAEAWLGTRAKKRIQQWLKACHA